MSENRFRGRELLPEKNLRLAALVELKLVEKASGLYVVFEEGEIDWPNRTRCEPFYVARHDLDRDGPETGTPQKVEAYLREPGWAHFIWIPAAFAHGDEGQFTIRYAHELKHYRQVLGADSLRHAREFLSEMRRGGFVPRLRIESDATECDAEIVAMDTFEAIHGRSALENFIQREDAEMTDFYRRVLFLREKFKSEASQMVV